MSLHQRAREAILDLLSMVPDDPPSNGMSGWNHDMREAWVARRAAAETIAAELGIESVNEGQQGMSLAHPADSPERARQLGVDPECINCAHRLSDHDLDGACLVCPDYMCTCAGFVANHDARRG